MEDTSFSFLTAQPEEQEEFLQRIKEYAQNVNASVPVMPDGDFVENMFSFVPLVETGEKQILTSSAIPQLITPPIGADANSRQWKLIHLSPLLAARNSISVNGVVTSPAALTVQQIMDEVRVEIRTRSEKPSQMMPERLYSSLKYELKQQVSLGFSDSQVLMAKIQVVNPADPTEEMVKNNGQGLIKGIQDMCVLSKTNNTYEAKFKIQFTDVSYHFENKHFALKVSYYDPSINIQEPMLIVVSSPFKVFARRPSKKVEKKEKTATPTTTTTKSKTTPKRKAASTEEAAAPKKQKISSPKSPITSTSSSPVLSSPSPVSSPLPPVLNSTIELRKSVTMKDFMDCLELLSAFKNALPKDELATALKLAQQKLFGNDDFESKFLAP